jgi:hypothetical protein
MLQSTIITAAITVAVRNNFTITVTLTLAFTLTSTSTSTRPEESQRPEAPGSPRTCFHVSAVAWRNRGEHHQHIEPGMLSTLIWAAYNVLYAYSTL